MRATYQAPSKESLNKKKLAIPTTMVIPPSIQYSHFQPEAPYLPSSPLNTPFAMSPPKAPVERMKIRNQLLGDCVKRE